MWTVGAFMASFGLVGAVLTLGLMQRWGEVFPRWMIGLAGRRVPIALAAVPAAIVSVLLMAGGIAIFTHHYQGGASAIRLLRGLVAGLWTMGVFFLVVAGTVERSGVATSFALAVAADLLGNAGSLWVVRRLRPAR